MDAEERARVAAMINRLDEICREAQELRETIEHELLKQPVWPESGRTSRLFARMPAPLANATGSGDHNNSAN